MNNETVQNIGSTSTDYKFNLAATIVLTIIGFIGNTIVLYILARPKFLNVTIFRYFIVSSINDLFELMTMWCYSLPDVFQVNQNSMSCKLVQYFVYLFYQFCPWIIVLSSIDRFLSVFYPMRFKF